MKITILVFGKIYDIIQNDLMILKNISSISELNEYLHSQYPELRIINYQIAVNKMIVKGNQKLHDGDEIALLPPFAGG